MKKTLPKIGMVILLVLMSLELRHNLLTGAEVTLYVVLALATGYYWPREGSHN